MKKADREFLGSLDTGSQDEEVTARVQSLKDSDKKQRARIRDLEARLKTQGGAIAWALDHIVTPCGRSDPLAKALAGAQSALDLRNKSWRKGGGK